MGQRLRAFDARHPVVYDLLVTAAVALVGVVAVADGSLDATVRPAVPDPPAALVIPLHLAFTVPLLGRRRHPLGVLWVLVMAAAVMIWSGLDHPGVLSLLLVAYSAALRVSLPRLAPPAAALVAATGVSAWRWHPDDVGPQYVPLLLTVAVAALLGLTVRARRQHHQAQVGLAVAAERARIAREMHDVVAHNLAVMVALADGATYSLPHAPGQATDMIAKVATTGREALGDMRRVVGVLRDGVGSGAGHAATTVTTDVSRDPPRPQPGFDDIDALVDQVRAAGLTVQLSRTGTPGPWGPSAGLAAYRIVQEALTNTLKHAGPRARAQVRLQVTPGAADIEVVDDGGTRRPAPRAAGPDRGCGREGRDGGGRDGGGERAGVADGPGDVRGHGLAGMAERVAAYDGRMEAGPRPGGGWRVVARLRSDGPDEGAGLPAGDRPDPRPGEGSAA